MHPSPPPPGGVHTPSIEDPTWQQSTTLLEEDDIEADEILFSAPQQPAVAENLPTVSLGRTHVAADTVEVTPLCSLQYNRALHVV